MMFYLDLETYISNGQTTFHKMTSDTAFNLELFSEFPVYNLFTLKFALWSPLATTITATNIAMFSINYILENKNNA